MLAPAQPFTASSASSSSSMAFRTLPAATSTPTPTPPTAVPDARASRPPSVNPTLQLDNDIAQSYARLLDTDTAARSAWIIVGYSPQGQQLPASPGNSPKMDDINGSSSGDSRVGSLTSFKLHVKATSFDGDVDDASTANIDDLTAAIRAALIPDQVQWAIVKRDDRVLCVQIFDGDVSGLRRARALVHGRALSQSLHGAEPLMQPAGINAFTTSWLMAKAGALAPRPSTSTLAPAAACDRDRDDGLDAPRASSSLSTSDGIEWERPVVAKKTREGPADLTTTATMSRSPLPSLHSLPSRSPPTHSLPTRPLPSPPLASPLPPDVPAKDDTTAAPWLLDADSVDEELLSLPGANDQRPHDSWLPSHTPTAPTIAATEDLQDLQDRWSQSVASLIDAHTSSSDAAMRLVSKDRHHCDHPQPGHAHSHSKSSTVATATTTTATASTAAPTQDTPLTVPTPRTSNASPTPTTTTTTTAESILDAQWDGSKTPNAQHLSTITEAPSNSSDASDWSGTPSEWQAQPDFNIVEIRETKHPLDPNLATVRESGESSLFDRYRSSGSCSSFEIHCASRSRDGGMATKKASLAEMPSDKQPQTAADSARLEEERVAFLRFQEAERRRIEELERSEKRQRERAFQKKDDRKRNEVMKRLISEQEDADSLAGGISIRSASAANSLKAPTRIRSRTLSGDSEKSRGGGSRRGKENNGSTPVARISDPPSLPLPAPPKAPTSVRPGTRSSLTSRASTSAGPQCKRAAAKKVGGAGGAAAARDPKRPSSEPAHGDETRQTGADNKAVAPAAKQRNSHETAASSFVDSVAILDPALTEEMMRNLDGHAFDLSIASWADRNPGNGGAHSRDASSASGTTQFHQALSEARKAKRHLKEQGLEGSSWISKVSDERVRPKDVDQEQLEDLKARPRPHHHPHQVLGEHGERRAHSPSFLCVDKDLPQPPPLSPGVPPKASAGDADADVKPNADTDATRLADKEELADQARRRALAAELAALEQIRVARQLQKQLEFELSEVQRRERERNDAENAARAKWAREQAQRNLLDAFERSQLESAERKRRRQVEEIRKVEAERAEQVANEKAKADQAEREAMEEAERRKENMLLRDRKLLEEMESRKAESAKREEKRRNERERREKLKSELRDTVNQTATAATPTPLLAGWLEVQPTDSNRWKRRYFHLTHDGLELFKDITATTASALEKHPLPTQAPEDAFEACQMPHSVYLTNEDDAMSTTLLVALESAENKERFVATIEVLLDLRAAATAS